MFVGFAFLIAGVLLLLAKLDLISGGFWDYFWPIILVALGAKMIFDRKKKF
jgi:uncharacterized membrane protein HdeD (DUF308 family)